MTESKNWYWAMWDNSAAKPGLTPQPRSPGNALSMPTVYRYGAVTPSLGARIVLLCAVCKQPAAFETSRKFDGGEYREPACEFHAKDFASKFDARCLQKGNVAPCPN
jgi:hypothetical protein